MMKDFKKTWKGRVRYERKKHTFIYKDVIRILKKLKESDLVPDIKQVEKICDLVSTESSENKKYMMIELIARLLNTVLDLISPDILPLDQLFTLIVQAYWDVRDWGEINTRPFQDINEVITYITNLHRLEIERREELNAS